MERQEITDKTGFDNGEEFDSEDEVRMYFSTESMEDMYGSNLRADFPELADQDALDEMAKDVISNRWHCTF
jgi:hypothetical protein